MSSNYVVKNIKRAGQHIVADLGDAGVATVHEAYGRRGLMGPEIRPIQTDRTVAGSAVTALCAPDDNLMVHAAIEVIEPGDLLVVATTAPSRAGYFGDLLASSVLARGGVGLVIDAGVRDSSTLREMDFPVWSRAVHSQGTVKETAGSVNLPIVCSGVAVNPGDVVVADDDGVVVVSRLEAPVVLEATNARLAKEEETRSRLEGGELGLDIYGLRSKLLDLGVEWLDDADNL